jgi:DNA-binding FadR family transcriptional regulator
MGLAHRIGREIVSGRIEPGAILPNEVSLSASFGTGRSAVREAVKMLAAKGLVESRPRRGTQVLAVRDWNLLDADVLFWLRQAPADRPLVREFLELRLGFEPEAAALAAQRGVPETIEDVRSAYKEMAAADAGRRDPVEADCQFHEAIIAATGNRFYQPLGVLVRTAISLTAPVTNALFNHRVGDLAAHHAVYLAIEVGDAALARERMRGLLTGVLGAVERAERLPDGVRRERSDDQSALVTPPST